MNKIILPMNKREWEEWTYLRDSDIGHFVEGVTPWPTDGSEETFIVEITEESDMFASTNEGINVTSRSSCIDHSGHMIAGSGNNREIDRGNPWLLFEEFPKYEIRTVSGEVEIRKQGSRVRNRVCREEDLPWETGTYAVVWKDGEKIKVWHHEWYDKYYRKEENTNDAEE